MARILGKKLKTEINTGDPAERDHRGTEARRKYFTEVNEGNEAVNRRWTQMGADELLTTKNTKKRHGFDHGLRVTRILGKKAEKLKILLTTKLTFT